MNILRLNSATVFARNVQINIIRICPYTVMMKIKVNYSMCNYADTLNNQKYWTYSGYLTDSCNIIRWLKFRRV